MNEKIAVIGIGRLGLCFAIMLEKGGYDVLGYDIREDYVESINDKTFDSFEPGVNEGLKESKNLKATTNLKETLEFSDKFFIFVRTESLPSGKYDHSQVESFLEELIEFGPQDKVKNIIISCNVCPGYSNEIQKRLKDFNYKVSFNPEWVAQGAILRIFSYPDLVVIGEADKESGDMVEEIHKNICSNDPPFHRMDRLSAEITKVGLNCFMPTKISYANMLGDIAIKSGVDPEPILAAIGGDSRVNTKFFKYGFGYGGPCVKSGTKVLANGKIMDIEKSNIVFSKIGERQKVLKHYCTPYEGYLFDIKIRGGHSVSLTPDHLVWVDNSGYNDFGDVHLRKNKFIGWKRTDDLVKKDLISVPIPKIKENINIDESLLQIYGWYLSEGNSEKCRINIRQKNKKTVERIAKLSSRSSILKDGDCYKVRIYGKELAEKAKKDFGHGSHNKKLPKWIFNLTKKCKYIFLKSYLEGDGNWSDRLSSFTVSEQLKDDLIMFYLALGYFPSVGLQIQDKEYKGNKWTSRGWRISLSKTDSEDLLPKLNLKFNFKKSTRRSYLKRKNNFLIPITNIEKTHYKGNVLNLETEDQTYAVPFTVHNCFPRDVRALTYYANTIGCNTHIVESVKETNKEHLEFQLQDFFKKHSKDETIVFDTVTYKRGTIIIEESQQLLYAVKIAAAGYKVIIKEHPLVIKQVEKIYPGLFIYEERE